MQLITRKKECAFNKICLKKISSFDVMQRNNRVFVQPLVVKLADCDEKITCLHNRFISKMNRKKIPYFYLKEKKRKK